MVQPHPPGSGGEQPPRGLSTPGGPPSAVNVGLVILAGLLLVGVATGGGRATLGQAFSFLVFYCGVFTLVSLTLTVILGLVATDRIMLVARHRVWVQSVHRTLGIVAISCLGLHIGTELAAARVSVFGALVPFTTAPLTIGAGSVGAYLMVLTMWTGIVRSRFAQTGKPWMWRPLHATAYLCWPVALWHGLNAGRPPAVWVTASYLVLGFLTTVALGLRLSAERARRRQQLAADRTTTLIAPIGRPEPVGYDGRAFRSSRSASRFRWDAPPADQAWSTKDSSVSRRADYRREPVEVAPVTAVPVTAIPSYEDSFVEPFAYAEREPFAYAERERFAYAEPEPERFAYAEPEPEREREPDPYVAEYYEPEPEPEPVYYDEPEPVATYRGVAAPVYDDYNPYAFADEPTTLTLRDRFAARRSAAAAAVDAAAAEAEAEAEAELDRDRYAADDTPTLVNLDTRRELRRQERDRAREAQQSAGRGKRHRADDGEDDIEYWNRMRGEAR